MERIRKDKIKGIFTGIQVGDALGMPVESWDAQRIHDKYGSIQDYHEPIGHKYLKGKINAGEYTDDTQLTLAVAEGLINGGLSMDAQVEQHVKAFKQSTNGWGKSTRESIRRLVNGVSWKESGQLDGEWTGRGNGVPMKIAPIAAYNSSETYLAGKELGIRQFIIDLSKMTHMTSISASAALAHIFAIDYCLHVEAKDFIPSVFISLAKIGALAGQNILTETIGDDDIVDRFALLYGYEKYTRSEVIDMFGGGSCYCYDSIPFAYCFFLKNYDTIDCVYNVINAGGDTDSNASMVGALLGALHGDSIFPEHLINGLNKDQRNQVDNTVDRFYDKFFSEG